MGLFNPQNNLGVEIFFVGIVIMVIFEALFVSWLLISDYSWRKAKAQEERKRRGQK
jgi:hypothetical protein